MCKINRPVINVAATAAKIKEYRIRAGYSVREIQNILSFSSPEAVYAYEKGKYLPTIDNMIILADVYDVRVLSWALMLLWWKWYTRQVKVLMPKGLRVRFSSEVNTYKWWNWDTRLPQKQLSSGNMGSSPILYITGR